LINKLKSFFLGTDPTIVTPYGGYANNDTMHALARVLNDKPISNTEHNSMLLNLWQTLKRFESDEREGVTVLLTWGAMEKAVTSDREGYVNLNIEHKIEFNATAQEWIPLRYSIKQGEETLFTTTTDVLMPSKLADYGIISDLDDTVLQTGVTSFLKWRLVKNSLLKGSHARIPFEGAANLYSLLEKGVSGVNQNPFFYLSNSPWNLYDYVLDFLNRNRFPKGVLLMRDMGFEHRRKKSYLEGNKYLKTKHILETYPKLNFILIGDAGEHDTDIYLSIAKIFTKRILAIYIRAVNRKSRIARIEKLIEQRTDIEVKIVHHSNEALYHARSMGYIK